MIAMELEALHCIAPLGKYRGSCQLAVGLHNNWAEGEEKRKKKKSFALGIFTWV